MTRLASTSALLFGLAAPAVALDQPTTWRDPSTGCAYLLTPQGGISPQLRRDGVPDCPGASAGSRLVDETVRGLEQGFDALRGELGRLRNRLNDGRYEEQL